MSDAIFPFIKELYPDKKDIHLHEPVFSEQEKKYVNQCLDEGMVSSVGPFVTEFEKKICEYSGAKAAVATSTGTAALHLALHVSGVNAESEVITQALTFVATAAAIRYCGASPVFIDSNAKNFGMCAQALEAFILDKTYEGVDGRFNKKTNKKIQACVPMHVFGLPVEIQAISHICKKYGIVLIEDAAESLGSLVNGQHTGTFAEIGIFSFNGNKIVTTGGGGMLLFQDTKLAAKAKHLSTTAKLPHPWRFDHDEVGFNYRLPNINAALGLAQMERLESFVENKRRTHDLYRNFCVGNGLQIVDEVQGVRSNYWLNTLLFENQTQRDQFLESSFQHRIFCRPPWTLISELEPYRQFQTDDLIVAKKLAATIANLPSGVRT